MLIDGFRYLARQDGGWNGAFAETEFSISDSPTSFPTSQLLITFQKTKSLNQPTLKRQSPAVTSKFEYSQK